MLLCVWDLVEKTRLFGMGSHNQPFSLISRDLLTNRLYGVLAYVRSYSMMPTCWLLITLQTFYHAVNDGKIGKPWHGITALQHTSKFKQVARPGWIITNPWVGGSAYLVSSKEEVQASYRKQQYIGTSNVWSQHVLTTTQQLSTASYMG